MAKKLSILIDTSGSMSEDCKGAVVKYVINTINSELQNKKVPYKVYLIGKHVESLEETANVKISYGGEFSLSALKSIFNDCSEDDCYALVSDGCISTEIEAFLSKYKSQIISVAIGSDALTNNLQRCSRGKNVYEASDIIAALREI
ncbi:MAG: hypothetical protein ACK5LL_16505 [Suipraeoptans sp.]